MRQYNWSDVLNGLNDVGADSLAPETGANPDPSQNILLNTFAQANETMTTVDVGTVVEAAQSQNWDTAIWSTFQWS